MINKDRENFHYRGGDLVYIISPLTSQLRTVLWKIAIKYVGQCDNGVSIKAVHSSSVWTNHKIFNRISHVKPSRGSEVLFLYFS